MPNLYQIRSEIELLLNSIEVDEVTGEILNTDIMEQLNQLQLSKEDKIEDVALFIKNTSALLIALKEEKRAFEQRIKFAENKIERAKQYLIDATEGSRFSTSKCQVSFRNTKAIEVVNEAAIPDVYKVTKTETRVDKKAIKVALDDSITVPGAVQVERKSVIIK